MGSRSRRTVRWSAGAFGQLLVIAVLVPLSAAAAGETCRGRAATLVGGPVRLLGTPGPDVVVTNGSEFLNTGGGDDLVCVTAEVEGSQISVFAGSGNDTVDSSGAPSWAIFALLGAGSDELLSGSADDVVLGGESSGSGDPFASSDTEADVIVTGDGRDGIYSGDFTDHNADVIDAGPGDDQIYWIGSRQGSGGFAAGSLGRDTLTLSTRAASMTLDNSTGRGLIDGAAFASWSGIEEFRIDSNYSPQTFEFIGGPGNEHLWLPDVVARVALGPGVDRVDAERITEGSSFSGGAGRDRFRTATRAQRLWLDMASGRLDIGSTRGDEGETTAAEFEVFSGYARASIWLRGTDGPDVLRPIACRVSVAGRGGADHIQLRRNTSCRLERTRRATLTGGGGRDRIIGAQGDDTIRGGRGRDFADGGRGSDVCEAEVAVRCESRLERRRAGTPTGRR